LVSPVKTKDSLETLKTLSSEWVTLKLWIIIPKEQWGLEWKMLMLWHGNVIIIIIYIIVLLCSYSKGFGVVEILLGKEHFLNMPNCILGILFYSMQFVLGKWFLSNLMYHNAVIMHQCWVKLTWHKNYDMDTEKCYQLTMSCRCCRSICFLGENDFNLQVFFFLGEGYGGHKKEPPTPLS